MEANPLKILVTFLSNFRQTMWNYWHLRKFILSELKVLDLIFNNFSPLSSLSKWTKTNKKRLPWEFSKLPMEISLLNETPLQLSEDLHFPFFQSPAFPLFCSSHAQYENGKEHWPVFYLPGICSLTKETGSTLSESSWCDLGCLLSIKWGCRVERVERWLCTDQGPGCGGIKFSKGIVRSGNTESKEGDTGSNTKMVTIRGTASIKERSGKQKFKLEGRDLVGLNAAPERKGIM